MLDEIRAMIRGEVPPPPVAELIGFELVDVQPGEATATLETGERHMNRMGVLYGGILCDLADAAMGMAYASTLEKGESFTTLELKINFLRATRRTHLRAIGRVVRGGRTVGMTECDIFDAEDRLVARASSTCMRVSA